MSEQALDLRRSLRIIWRHKFVVVAAAIVGLVGGGAYAEHKPPTFTSTALVVLPANTRDAPTQVLVAESDNVLVHALVKITPPVSLQALRTSIQVKELSSNAMSITAQGKTATQAEQAANAVSSSYISYVGSSNTALGRINASMLAPATYATGTPLYLWLAIVGGLGLLVGLILGCIGILAVARRDRRLRQRDEIADAIGVSVLASLPVRHPSDANQWAKLFDDYQPTALQAWRLQTALRYLGVADSAHSRANNGHDYSVTVLSLSSDRRALALGPQLAVYAAAYGIPTALVVGPADDANFTATLRAACAAPKQSAKRSNLLRVAVADRDHPPAGPPARLTVVVTVVDSRSPQLAGAIRTRATVLGVSAGAVTAEQLARVAASAAADGRQIDGILVADPEADDPTTGRIPQLVRPRPVEPNRLTDVPMETRP